MNPIIEVPVKSEETDLFIIKKGHLFLCEKRLFILLKPNKVEIY